LDVVIEEPANVINKTQHAYAAKLLRMNEARESYGVPPLDDEQMALLKEEQSEQHAGEALQSFLQFGPTKTARINEDRPDPNHGEIQLRKDLTNAYKDGNKNIIASIGQGVQRERIDAALDRMNEQVVIALSQDAARQYAYGSAEAYARMRMVADATSLSTRMQTFASDYARLAITEGVTIIDGEKNNWIARKTEEQRTEIYDIINKGIAEGKYPGTIQDERTKGTIAYDLAGYFKEQTSRAETVARTESRRIMNSAGLETYAEMGVTQVEVLDGDGRNPCDICNQLNGRIWSVDFAMDHTLEHPNCVRRFSPIIPKDGYRISNNNEKLFKSRILLVGYVR
jgi:SPP1 gp7 family putative phage head morphogenesis protein